MKPLRSASTRPSPVRPSPPRARSGRDAWTWHYQTLLALRDHLLGDNGDRAREPGEAMEPPSLHMEDFADEIYDRTLAGSLPRDPKVALREVNAALHRIEHGIYGKCEVTGRPIAKALLRAQPWRRYAPHRRVARRAPAVRSPST